MVKRLSKESGVWFDLFLSIDKELFVLGVEMSVEVFTKNELEGLCKALNARKEGFFFFTYNGEVTRVPSV